MPTYAYSGLSSTSSLADPPDQQHANENPPLATAEPQGATAEARETREGHTTVSELSDFQRVVDLLLEDHKKLEAQRIRIFTQNTIIVLLWTIPFSLLIIYFFDRPKPLALASALTVSMMIISWGILFSVSRGSLRRQRRTYEELAELVRETAPVFMPKLSLIRRAEIKIRLSEIGIYDPLKYR